MKHITKERMKMELERMPSGFEDEPTIIEVSEEVDLVASPDVEMPPALPFTLVRPKAKNREGDQHWILALDPAARAILERATLPAPNWPFAHRLAGAVATPAQKIPSLSCPR